MSRNVNIITSLTSTADTLQKSEAESKEKHGGWGCRIRLYNLTICRLQSGPLPYAEVDFIHQSGNKN
jgi:hypothetical protein